MFIHAAKICKWPNSFIFPSQSRLSDALQRKEMVLDSQPAPPKAGVRVYT